jgi:hypothetical protein
MRCTVIMSLAPICIVDAMASNEIVSHFRTSQPQELGANSRAGAQTDSTHPYQTL